jgi:hypothetical protein
MDHVLDNPVWHALTGPHAAFAIGSGRARHYPRDIVPFSAFAEPTPAAYRDLAVDLPPNTEARLHRLCDESVPPGWNKIAAYPMLQMVADRIEGALPDGRTVVSLGESDIEAMLELMAATNPGRFGPRTPILGTYLGIRDGDRLIAMAGERIRVRDMSSLAASPRIRRRAAAAMQGTSPPSSCVGPSIVANVRFCICDQRTRRPYPSTRLSVSRCVANS